MFKHKEITLKKNCVSWN